MYQQPKCPFLYFIFIWRCFFPVSILKSFHSEAAAGGVLWKKVFLKISRSSQGKPQACNFIKKETPALVFSCKFCQELKSTLFTEHLRTIASAHSIVNFYPLFKMRLFIVLVYAIDLLQYVWQFWMRSLQILVHNQTQPLEVFCSE